MSRARSRRWCLWAAASLALACGRSGGKTPSEAPAQVRACADAIAGSHVARSAADTGAARVAAIAAGCDRACPGLAPYARSLANPPAGVTDAAELGPLLRGCAAFCDDDARRAWEAAPPPARWGALIDACGPEYYGLRADDAVLLSDTWLALYRVHSWLRRSLGDPAIDDDLRAAVDRATGRAHIPLPLPAQVRGMYSLPAADAARPVRAVLYAVVTAAEVRLAAVPVVRLRGDDRMDRRLVPGGHFPGTPVHVAELAARRAELRAQLAALHPDSEALARRQTPLLLADRALPARQVFAVAEALSVQRVRLAVAGLSARAHSVALGHAPETGSAAPLLDVRPDAFAITASRSVTIPRGAPDSPDGAPDSPDGAPGGQNDATARAQLVAELSQIALMQAPEDRVELKDSSDMTVAELAQLLDAIAEARFTTLLYRPSAGAATRAKPGSSAPRE